MTVDDLIEVLQEAKKLGLIRGTTVLVDDEDPQFEVDTIKIYDMHHITASLKFKSRVQTPAIEMKAGIINSGNLSITTEQFNKLQDIMKNVTEAIIKNRKGEKQHGNR